MKTTQMNQHGVAGALLQWWTERRSKRQESVQQLRIVDALTLNSKQKLMLVDCAGQTFLVGVGLEQISAIVKVESSEGTIGRDLICD